MRRRRYLIASALRQRRVRYVFDGPCKSDSVREAHENLTVQTFLCIISVCANRLYYRCTNAIEMIPRVQRVVLNITRLIHCATDLRFMRQDQIQSIQEYVERPYLVA